MLSHYLFWTSPTAVRGLHAERAARARPRGPVAAVPAADELDDDLELPIVCACIVVGLSAILALIL